MMIRGADVLNFLIPTGGWSINGNDFEGITFHEAEPITKAQFEAGFALVEAAKLQEENTKTAEKSALLAKLGITDDEAKLLLS
jgi:hypothetical protein